MVTEYPKMLLIGKPYSLLWFAKFRQFNVINIVNYFKHLTDFSQLIVDDRVNFNRKDFGNWWFVLTNTYLNNSDFWCYDAIYYIFTNEEDRVDLADQLIIHYWKLIHKIKLGIMVNLWKWIFITNRPIPKYRVETR
jgi:hypothetical protein